MKIFWSIDDAKATIACGALAIGNFDGVHRGHQALIKKARSLAPAGPVGVLTFTPHPSHVLKKNSDHVSIMTDHDKIAALACFDVDVAILHTIDEEFLNVSPDAFVRDMLFARLSMRHVVVGDDFTFGKAALGTTKLLKTLGDKLGFHTAVISQIMIDGERCSSTAIRNYLRGGTITKANAMLGRSYSLSGIVVPGHKRGALLGFPTANLLPREGFPLARGVYGTVTRVDGHDYVSVTNIGCRPTVTEEKTVVVETHIFDRKDELYGKEIQIFFVDHLRSEKKFAGLEELQEQIAQDCARVCELQRSNPTRFQIKD